MLKREHFIGVVWPRQQMLDSQGSPAYRYTVVGMLVTDKPIEEFEGKNEVVLEGVRHVDYTGVGNSLALLPQHKIELRSYLTERAKRGAEYRDVQRGDCILAWAILNGAKMIAEAIFHQTEVIEKSVEKVCEGLRRIA